MELNFKFLAAIIIIVIIAAIILYFYKNNKNNENFRSKIEGVHNPPSVIPAIIDNPPFDILKNNNTMTDVVPGAIRSYYNRFTADDAKNGLGQIIVVYHYAPWCRYCKEMSPVFDLIADDLKSAGVFTGVTLIKNDEEKKPTAGINSYPTIIRYQAGKMRRYTGRARYNDLREWILNQIGPTISFFPQ